MIVILSLIIYLLLPYYRVQYLTKKYGFEFLNLFSENGFYNNIEYLRVFKYRDENVNIFYLDSDELKTKINNLDDNYAVVLYVEENHNSASLFIFYDEEDQWELSSWVLIWSWSGSADGFMWPCYL